MIEAVLLTGGASRRMGEDKAKLVLDGEELAVRIARLLGDIPVTVCGREPLPHRAFIEDKEAFAGPLAALARFEPSADLVFVSSCDLPGFDPEIVIRLQGALGASYAAVPEAEGKLQPLCALYRREAFDVARRLVAGGERRVMRWLEFLDYVAVPGIDPRWVKNVNSPEDLQSFLA
jgi:molybdopterin-guanine dinucleotide biosynthesis protein A